MPSCPASIVTPNGENMTPAFAQSILAKVQQTRDIISVCIVLYIGRCGSLHFVEIENRP
jgi:hypothetical protein